MNRRQLPPLLLGECCKTMRKRHRSGFTLLEVMLALALTVVVMSVIGVAIFLHLRSVDGARVTVERDLLARTLMRRIGDDVRAAVRREPFDDAGLQAMMSGAKNAAKSLLGGGGQGGATSGGNSSPGQGRTGSTGGTGTTGTTGTAGTTQPLSSSSGDSSAADDTAATDTLSAVAGLYGAAYELQIDVARVPRPDEFAEAMMAGTPPPSDVKTVYYFLANAESGTSPNGESGLMRSEVNRATALYARQNGSSDVFLQNAQLLASEVIGLEFRYFDGLEWLTEWDSQVMNGLPMAVEIALVVTDPSAAAEAAITGTQVSPAFGDVDPELVYHTVVHVPNGQISKSTGGTGGASSGGGASGAGSGLSGTSTGGNAP